MAINWERFINAGAYGAPPSRVQRVAGVARKGAEGFGRGLRTAAVNWVENVSPTKWRGKDRIWVAGALLGTGIGIWKTADPGVQFTWMIGSTAASFIGTQVGKRLESSNPTAAKRIGSFMKGVSAGVMYGSLGYELVTEGIMGAINAVRVPEVPATATPTRIPTEASIGKPTSIPGSPVSTEVPRVSPVPSPEASATPIPTEAPIRPTSTVSAPTATETPTRIPAATETPTRVPTSTHTPPPTSPVPIPGETPVRTRPIAGLNMDFLSFSSDVADTIEPMSNVTPLIPTELTEAQFAANTDLESPQNLAHLREVANKEGLEAEGARRYAITLKQNLGKLNPFNQDLGIVTEEAVANARADANFQEYESALADQRMVEAAEALKPQIGSIRVPGSLQYIAEVEHGQWEGAAKYAESLKEGTPGPNGNIVNIEDIKAANTDTQIQWAEADSARKDLDLVKDPIPFVPPADHLVPEVRIGLPNFGDQVITVPEGSSFWSSWEIDSKYLAQDTPKGWVNFENGVTQADVVKGEVVNIARENGVDLNHIKAGEYRLEDLVKTKGQWLRVRRIMFTKSLKDYKDILNKDEDDDLDDLLSAA